MLTRLDKQLGKSIQGWAEGHRVFIHVQLEGLKGLFSFLKMDSLIFLVFINCKESVWWMVSLLWKDSLNVSNLFPWYELRMSRLSRFLIYHKSWLRSAFLQVMIRPIRYIYVDLEWNIRRLLLRNFPSSHITYFYDVLMKSPTRQIFTMIYNTTLNVLWKKAHSCSLKCNRDW